MIRKMTPFHALLAFAATAAQAAGFNHSQESELLEFSYSWPAAVEAEPSLRETLRAEMNAEQRRARQIAEQWRAETRFNGGDFQPHYFAKGWEVAGLSPQLLSLTASRETFSGGAHGNTDFSAILWDRQSRRPVPAAAMLGAAALASMSERYCAALDAERAERRGEPVTRDPQDQFSLCPPLAEQVLAPTDSDGNGRFDTLAVLIAPYVAGPYAEGAYSPQLPFRAGDLEGVPENYRSAFEEGPAGSGGPDEEGCGEEGPGQPLGAGAICIERETDSYLFSVAWPAEAEAIPALAAMLRREAAQSEARLGREAQEATSERTEGRDQPMRFSYDQGWSVDANLPELVAVSGAAQDYTGGAHGGIAYYTILLDRRRGERIQLGDLFADRAAGLAAVQESLCRALAAEVGQRRGADDRDYACPPAAEHPVSLVCGAGPRIDLMMALLNPYVIGSWAEGPYEFVFPVTPRILAALKPQYRSAFTAREDMPEEPPATSRCAGAAAG
jgi:hypothetical protein